MVTFCQARQSCRLERNHFLCEMQWNCPWWVHSINTQWIKDQTRRSVYFAVFNSLPSSRLFKSNDCRQWWKWCCSNVERRYHFIYKNRSILRSYYVVWNVTEWLLSCMEYSDCRLAILRHIQWICRFIFNLAEPQNSSRVWCHGLH